MSVAENRVAFGGEDEIAFGQPADLMRPNLDAELPPRHVEIGMVLLFFGHPADCRRRIHSAGEVLEAIGSLENAHVAGGAGALGYAPTWFELFQQRRDAFAGERRYAATAWNAISLRETAHQSDT